MSFSEILGAILKLIYCLLLDNKRVKEFIRSTCLVGANDLANLFVNVAANVSMLI